nr:hypothetical protein [uncultured Rhodopila sp.]
MRTIILPRRRALALAAAGWTALAVDRTIAAEESAAYVVDVSDVTVKVGEPAVMLATARVRDGYRILTAYNNRVIRLSSYDDGVIFDNDMVPAKVDDRALVFPVGLRAVKPGTHPINGLLRVGYIHGTDEMAMVSMRLIASVTAKD